jgi:subtilisin family serine protease
MGINAADVVPAIQYAIERRTTGDPTVHVINLSLGSSGVWYPCSCDDSNAAFYNAIFQANNAGIVTFAATGNDIECGGISAPACVSSAVRVAAEYDANYGIVWIDPPGCGDFSAPYRLTCFSNVTDGCDWFLAAPGYDISVGGFSSHGTSQATAHCSGVGALMYSKAVGCDMNGWTARQLTNQSLT